MEKFTVHTGRALPLRRSNVDTDQIIPAEYLKRITRTGFEDGLFAAWRKNEPDFVLNQPQYADASILVAGPDFGTGSSREHAVWALMDFGFRAVIAPSFSDIFHNNCLKNGMLPVTLPVEEVRSLVDALLAAPGGKVRVDLPVQTVTGPDGDVHRFAVDPFAKTCLLEGLDEIGLTLTHAPEIDRYERERKKATPWLFLDLAG